MFKKKENNLFLFSITGVILILGFFAFYIFKNFSSKIKTDQSKLQVVTSFYPLYFFTSQIVGEKAGVYNITPAGSEPHDYEPSTQDIARIEDSQLLILNGGKLEAWGDGMKSNLKDKNISVITVGDVFASHDLVENGETIRDPHIWLDPKLAKQEVAAITNGLIQVNPQNSPYYLANAKILSDKLDNLDSEYSLGLSKCLKKDIITSHAAFGYLANDYGLNQVAISGLSPDAEPSIEQLSKVTDFAKANQVEYIFFESLVSPKFAQTIAQEMGAKTLVLNPLEGLTDEEIRGGKNYFTEMESNLNNLKLALKCQ